MKVYSVSEIMLDAPSRRQRKGHRGLSAFPWASLEALVRLGARLAAGSSLSRLTPAVPVHRRVGNGRLCGRDNVLRHLFDKGAF